jgi:uncharacterized protein
MLTELKQLLHLQSFDKELHQLRADIKRLGPVLDGLRADRTRRQSLAAKRRQKLDETVSSRRKLELDMKDMESRLQKTTHQMELVRTPREAEAAQSEMDKAKGAISAFEDQILQLLEQEEQLAANNQTLLARELHLDTQAAEEESRLLVLKSEKEDLIKDLLADRQAALNAVDDDFRDSYESLLKRFGPPIVVPIHNRACGSCGTALVPKDAMDVEKGERVVQCLHCRRFLMGSSSTD